VGPQAARVYEFGSFRLDGSERQLLRLDGTSVSLTSKAFDTLTYLVEHAGVVLQKDALMRAIWANTAVEENNLNQNISILRRALGEGLGGRRYIATVPGRGYQFVARVIVVPKQPAQSQPFQEASIAVLPFANLSADPDNEYFCDGLAEELINTLSQLHRVRVVARTSAFSFKGKQADIREIAEKLGVNMVLQGSVRKSGNRLRITSQLIDTADGCHLWSQRYDREMEMRDIFEVQDEITLAVVDALKLKLPPGEKSAALRHHTENVKAHELYLKGRFHLFRMTPPGITSGLAHFQEAIQADPSDALPHVGLAHAYRMFATVLGRFPNEFLPKAKAAAERAIEQALELNQNSADTHWMYGVLLSSTGRHEEALAEVARARELDPLSGLINAQEGISLLHAGRTDEAVLRFRETVELDPNDRLAHTYAADAYAEKGLLAEALAEARAARALFPEGSHAIAREAYVNSKLGRKAEARAALGQLLQISSGRYVPAYQIAIIHHGLDEPGETLLWLERAFEQRDPSMVFLKVHVWWKNLHDDPRFVSLLKRMNLFP
jgi:TolB-like protein/Flp pilus assembly protein TadD